MPIGVGAYDCFADSVICDNIYITTKINVKKSTFTRLHVYFWERVTINNTRVHYLFCTRVYELIVLRLTSGLR